MRKSDSSKAGTKTAKNTDFQGAHLGIMRITQPVTSGVASSGSPITFVDKETGEIYRCEHLEDSSLKPTEDPAIFRLEKFIFQSAISNLLPRNRVSKCLVLRSSGAESVAVLHNSKLGTAHYGCLQTCGSVWHCPICAAKIAERRRVKEVLPAMEKWESQGGECLLLTLTHSHGVTDVLLDLLKGQQKAMSNMTGSRAYRLLKEQIGMVGTIRAWEVTHNTNGFHPHFHIILFVRAGLDFVDLADRFYSIWANSCRVAGLPSPDRKHGVKVSGTQHTKSYATKGVWGLDHELTKGHLKKSNKGRSPMDLIRSYVYEGDKQAAALFIEYSNAFHGKRQLQWSIGLKDYFGIGELSDDEIAALQDQNAILLGRIEWPVWKLVLRSKLRGDILELGRSGLWEPILILLNSLVAQSIKFTKVSK